MRPPQSAPAVARTTSSVRVAASACQLPGAATETWTVPTAATRPTAPPWTAVRTGSFAAPAGTVSSEPGSVRAPLTAWTAATSWTVRM